MQTARSVIKVKDKDIILESDVLQGLETDFIGREICLFDELESTNKTAYQMAAAGAKEGTVVIADGQSGGKGRRGRAWFSPPGKNIYTSIILRPAFGPDKAPRLTLVAAVALAETVSEALKDFPGIKAELKWPNDILVRDRKCAGILTEMKVERDKADFVVIGTGINININKEDLPDELCDIATSLLIETERHLTRADILQSLYINLENWYKVYLAEGFGAIKERWNMMSAINGRHVRVASGTGIAGDESNDDGYEEGTANGINDEGALLLKKEDGRVIEVTAGDIIVQ